MITVIYHKADYDGIFSREAARHFLPKSNVEYVGWDFTDEFLPIPDCGLVYVLDLPVDRVFGIDFNSERWPDLKSRLVWIDHHNSSIKTHPTDIDGYRIDGVAACRLAWQFFRCSINTGGQLCQPYSRAPLPDKQAFLDRKVNEPWAMTLAGEYDIWDHRGDGDLEFQFGLDAQEKIDWATLLCGNRLDGPAAANHYAERIVREGKYAIRCYAKRDGDVMRERSFLQDFEGMRFLALNTPRCNSNTFKVRDIPATGHDALMAFFWTGKDWSFSLYHAAHRKDIDLSRIAIRYGGGGHKGACGFRVNKLPF